MKLGEWKSKIKAFKKSQKDSYNLFLGGRVFSLPEGFELRRETECSKCKHEDSKVLRVMFDKKPEYLSQFQTGLLWCVFVLNVLPHDYARYHSCPAGKEFIENMSGVTVQ